SGCLRNASQALGHEAGSAPLAASHVALQLTERSPRMFSVSIASTPPASGIPTRMPHCCCTVGSDNVGSMRPYSIGRPLYCSRSGMNVDALTVCVGYFTGEPPRVRPVTGLIGLPSAVTSAVHVPL